MNRRKFLTTAAWAAPVLGATVRPWSAAADLKDADGETFQLPQWRFFEVATHVTLPGSTSAAQLYLPMVQTASDYQIVEETSSGGEGGTHQRLTDTRYGASVLRSEWDKEQGSEPKTVNLVQTVATRDRNATPFQPLTEAERRFWTAPTPSAPTDGIVLATAAKIVAGKARQRDQVRAIYDWVVDHTHRDPDTPGCGTGDVLKSLASGQLGGKCADINSLLVALARAAGFPAREVYGLRVTDSEIYPCLGKKGDLSKAQHCRCEVFLDDEGWLPLDPADVRKVVLEQKVALASAEGRALRERMFGAWEMNWVGYNSATDIALPGSGGRKPDFPFLMYPCAFTDQGTLPCLDPAHFHYEITARELTA